VLKENPRHAEARNLLGLVHWSVGRRAEARGEFARALEINPYFSDARVNLGVIMSEEGHFGEAEAEFQRALDDKTYPTPEKPLVNLAVNLMKQGRPRQALERAERAIRTNPRYTRAFEVFVQALQGAERDGAGVEYRTLLRDLDRSQDFHLNLAQAFLKENDSRRARAHLQRVVALDSASEQATRARQALEKIP
jgi:Tfp pilus assembly protein PilF